MTPEERKHIDNGIWLCGNHHDTVDGDSSTFTPEALRRIKSDHEARVKKAHDCDAQFTPPSQGHRGDDLIAFEFWSSRVNLEELANEMIIRHWYDNDIVIRVRLIERLASFIEDVDSALAGRYHRYDMKTALDQFVRAVRDFMALLEEAEPEPMKAKNAGLFAIHELRGEYLYVVDTDKDLASDWHISDQIRFEKNVLLQVMFCIAVTANGIIHVANGVPLYKEPVKYALLGKDVPPMYEQPYPGLQEIRRCLLSELRHTYQTCRRPD